MNYKIAVASSDQQVVDLSFGECEEFGIYEVDERGNYRLVERRICKNDLSKAAEVMKENRENRCGCGGSGMGCVTMHGAKVGRLADCRCILCIRAGEKVKKLFDAKAIPLFEIEGVISTLIEKIIVYYARADR